MDKIEELFGKEFAEKIENTRDNVQTYNDLRMIDGQIHHFASFIKNCGDEAPFFNCRIKVVNNSSDDDYDDYYSFYTSGKKDCNRIRLIPRDELLDKLVDGTLHAPETAEGLKELQQAYNNLSEQIVILAKDLTIDFYNKLKEKDPKVEEVKGVLVHRFIDTLTCSIIAKTEIELGINNDIRGIQ